MSFTGYEEYKNSGFDWLGDIPNHWKTIPLWTYFRKVKRTGFIDEELLSVYRDHGVILKASRDDNHNRASDDLEPYQLVNIGDLVINKMKAFQGSVAISDYRGIVSPAYFVFEGNHSSNPRFLHYLMRSNRYIFAYLSISKGIRPNQWDLEPQYHSRLPLVIPPKPEQKIIADFLDHEIAKIDILVTEQEKLIELLKEKRQAVISHTVSKGLNPNVKMKNSGVKWLGEIPQHWSMIKVFRGFSNIGSGTTPPSDETKWYEDGTIPWVTTGELREALITDTQKYVTQKAMDKFTSLALHPTGSLVIAMYGATIGRLAILGLNAVTNQACCVLSGSTKIQIKYAFYWFQAFKLNIIEIYATGGGQPNINQQIISSLKVSCPGSEEQETIIRFLDGEISKINLMLLEIEKAIDLLQERRFALISAAVTGQIDVRNYQPKEVA